MVSNVDRVFNVGNERELVDSDGVAFGTDSNRIQVEASQLDLYSTFTQILKELKKINLHLALMNDDVINDTEVM